MAGIVDECVSGRCLQGWQAMSERMYYVGSNFTAGKYKWVYGERGEVVGPATSDSYKGKGLRYVGEVVRLKPGKRR